MISGFFFYSQRNYITKKISILIKIRVTLFIGSTTMATEYSLLYCVFKV